MRSLLLASLALLLLQPQQAAAQLSSARAPGEFLVASESQGLLRVSREGEVLEVLTSTPALTARRADDERIIFLSPEGNTLHEYNLRAHSERIVATIPNDTGLGCGGIFGGPEDPAAPYTFANHLQFESSMAADGTRACFEVMDRNLNMLSVLYLLDVPLDGSAITSTIIVSSHCGGVSYEAQQAIPCARLIRRRVREQAPRRPSRRAAWTLEVHHETGTLRGPNNARRRLALTEPIIESTSSDGRWGLLSANREEGDYIYRSLYLVDLARGQLHAIEESEGAHPIAPATLRDARALGELGMLVTGETSVAWVEHGRTLILGGNLVVHPGRRIFRLPGARVP
jgi:hypothetical protein